MAQNTEARAFLRRLGELPDISGVDLGPAITPSLQDEAALRRLFATDRDNARLKDPYVGLIDVFGQNTDRIKKTHARTIKDDLLKHHVMPLDATTRRMDGELSMASSLEDFKLRWSIFSEGALSQLTNWNNVVVAGGSALACLAPLPECVIKQNSKRAIRQYYHSQAYPASDVDLFLYGLTPEQAEEKCIEIYNAVRDSVPWEVCAVRTKNAVSIHCQYPYRPVQIILRTYQSPAEILAGFDVDCACVAFDGTRVLAAPRAIVALMTQCNRVAMDRRSPSYEVRLAKYAERGFEIHLPDLRREDFDPTIFERALTRVAGLARLLVLERLSTQEARDAYMEKRSQVRARPNASSRAKRRDRRLKGDLKTAAEFGGLQMSEYDVMFHIPYGPGIDAKRIAKIVYKTDLGLNSTFNPNNQDRIFHRHPFFFGSIQEALGDCCKYCPVPETDEERAIFEKEQEQFITGRVSFIQEDPGRQSITGSFRPIDSGEWSAQAYLKPTLKLYSYIAAHNRPACNEFLKRNAEAVNTRDYLGRTPLQFALLCSAGDICLDLIEQGARMTARMVDGRYSLHLAAQMDLPKVVKALLEKSEKNKAEKEARENKGKDKNVEMKDRDHEIRDSSEDDWSSENDEHINYKEAKKNVEPKGDSEDLLEDTQDRPDVVEINELDWDQCLTPLDYAIISGSLISVQILVAAGADCKTPGSLSDQSAFYPLTLTALTPDESVGAQIAEQLITVGGASSEATDANGLTVFHRLVSLNKPQIVETILKVDRTAKAASRCLYTGAWRSTLHPIVSAFADGQRAMVAVLLAYAGTRPFIDLETYDRSIAVSPHQSTYARGPWAGKKDWKTYTLQPLEASLEDYNDLYRLVLALEPKSAKHSVPRGIYNLPAGAAGLHRSMLDLLRSALREVKRRSRGQPVQVPPNTLPISTPPSNWRSIFDLSDLEISAKTGWEKYVIGLEKRNKAKTASDVKPHPQPYNVFGSSSLTDEEQRARAAELIPYFEQAVEELEKAGAQTWDEIYPTLPSQWKTQFGALDRDPDDPGPPIPAMVPAPTANQSLNPFPLFQTGTSFRPFEPSGQGPGLVVSQIDDKSKPFKRYSLFKSDYGEDYPGTHLIPLYDELYQACWNGDNDKIRALCLPPDDDTPPPQSGTRDLLQITARVKYTEQANENATGYTPLYVALRARKWDTARLILEIAQKQLMKEQDYEVSKPARRNRDIVTFNENDDEGDGEGYDDEEGYDEDDEDEDDSDADSCASDQTQKAPTGYINLAKRFQTVSVKVKPNQLLSYQTKANASGRTADPITLAVLEKDVEAFHQIADMMEGLEEPMPMPQSLCYTILGTDSPEMLDAFIRRTGEGLSLPKPETREFTDDSDPLQNHNGEYNGRKIYLGLDVDGQKRKDLACEEDPDAPSADAGTGDQAPIVCSAASFQAMTILEYLSSLKAIEAYKYYAETKKTTLAKRLAQVLEHTNDFPQLVGFSVSRSVETPVLAALRSPPKPDKIVPTLTKLMELQPRLTADAVRLQDKPGKMSPLLYLCICKAPVEAFDWMLANGADPDVRDDRGWNILHVLFDSHDTNWTLIEHVLTKLPANVIQALMVQQSRTLRNTPFAAAVKKARLRVVELLLRTVKDAVVPTLLLRDSTGATPLHSAILQGYSKIVSLLVSTGFPETLYLENGVGSTPMEIARLQFLTLSLRGLVSRIAEPTGFSVKGIDFLDLRQPSGMRDRDEKEVKSLRRVIDGIKSSGVLATKPGLLKILSDFADRSEQEFATWVGRKPKDEVSSINPTANNGMDVCDVKATFDVLSRAVVEVHQRQLVSSRDVQLAVLAAVESSN